MMEERSQSGEQNRPCRLVTDECKTNHACNLEGSIVPLVTASQSHECVCSPSERDNPKRLLAFTRKLRSGTRRTTPRDRLAPHATCG